MNREELFKIYESYIGEEHFAIESHQKRIQYFTTLVSTLFGVTIAAAIQVKEWWHFSLLIFAVVIIVIVCDIAKKSISRVYYIALEIITSRAKTEQLLGLTDPIETGVEVNYWKGEPLIAKRHLESRAKFDSSSQFMKELKDKGYQKLITSLFTAFQIVSALLAIALIFLSVKGYK